MVALTGQHVDENFWEHQRNYNTAIKLYTVEKNTDTIKAIACKMRKLDTPNIVLLIGNAMKYWNALPQYTPKKHKSIGCCPVSKVDALDLDDTHYLTEKHIERVYKMFERNKNLFSPLFAFSIGYPAVSYRGRDNILGAEDVLAYRLQDLGITVIDKYKSPSYSSPIHSGSGPRWEWNYTTFICAHRLP
jgi:hypothetical protein